MKVKGIQELKMYKHWQYSKCLERYVSNAHILNH